MRIDIRPTKHINKRGKFKNILLVFRKKSKFKLIKTHKFQLGLYILGKF